MTIRLSEPIALRGLWLTNRIIAARYLRAFAEEMKASGFVAKALARSGQPDAVVAPAAQ